MQNRSEFDRNLTNSAEIHGFLWENYDGVQLCISQSFWKAMQWNRKPARARLEFP